MTNVQIIRRLEMALGSIQMAMIDLNQVDGYGACKEDLRLVAGELAVEINALEELEEA